MKKNLTMLILIILALPCFAQEGSFIIDVIPDRDNWLYNVGEPVTFKISVSKDKKPLKNVKIRYTLGYEKMEPYETKEINSADGTLTVRAKGMDTPGFLACRAFVEHEGEKNNTICQVGFEPEKLRPITTMPDDFQEFWDKAKKNNERIPLNPVITRVDSLCNDKVECFYVRIDNYREGAHVYGSLTIPKGEGKFPAVVQVPGAGVSKIGHNIKLAEKGIITLAIGIHGIPLDMEKYVYEELRYGALHNYQYSNLDVLDQYYYHRVFMGCVRAIDFIYTLPQYDGDRLLVLGGSQGGGLSLITTALDSRVKYYVSFYPAMCDFQGYLHNRAGGWPHMFDESRAYYRTPARIENSRYYDAANFARLIKVPGFLSWGYNDLSCPITSMYSAYNVISAPKELLIEPINGHRRSKTQDVASEKWILNKFDIKDK